MEALPAPRDDHGALLSRLKRALDPNDILAPGRYDFRSTWRG
jgi:4-cresol dehydrogenase (hydroxylating)